MRDNLARAVGLPVIAALTAAGLTLPPAHAGGPSLVYAKVLTSTATPDNGTAVAFGGGVLFAASDGTSGSELWRRDGTFLGTTLVRDIAPGTADANVGDLTAAPGRTSRSGYQAVAR